MTKKILMFVVIIFLLQPVNYSNTVGHAKNLDIAVHEFCPYLCDRAKENGKDGYVVDLLRAIYEPFGYRISFIRVPYKRGLLLVEKGKFHGMPMLNTHSSQKIKLSREPIGILVQNFYVKKGHPWKYKGVSSLKGIKVGSILGYNYSPWSPEYETYLRANQNTDQVEYIAGVDASLINLRKIQIGRITTFNECADLVDYVVKKEGMDDQFQIAGTIGSAMNFMGFSSVNPEAEHLLNVFDREIIRLRKSGELDGILEIYGISDWVME